MNVAARMCRELVVEAMDIAGEQRQLTHVASRLETVKRRLDAVIASSERELLREQADVESELQEEELEKIPAGKGKGKKADGKDDS